KAALTVEPTTFTEAAEVTLPTPTQEGVTITWTIEEGKESIAKVENGKLIITLPAEDATVKLTATITCGEASDTKDFPLTVKAAVTGPSDADKVAAEKEALEFTKTTIDTDTPINLPIPKVYPDDLTFTWVSSNEDVLRPEGAKLYVTLPASETDVELTVTITCGAVNDTRSFPVTVMAAEQGGQVSDEETVLEAYELAVGASLSGTHTLTGVITSIDEKYSTQFKNVTVTMVVGNLADKLIKCYRLEAGTAEGITDTTVQGLKVGDTITVSGTLKNFNGEIEFDAKCTLDAYIPAGEVLSDAAKVAIEARDLTVDEGPYTEGTEVTLPVPQNYNDVVITWESDSECAVVDNGKLVITQPDKDTIVKLIATIKLNEVTATKEFNLDVRKPAAANEITAAYTVDASDFSDASNITGTTITFTNGVKLSFSLGNNTKNNFPILNSGVLRIYWGNTFTFTAPEGTSLTKIVFTFGSGDGSNAITASTGTFSGNTWTGNVSTVTFTIDGAKGNRRFQEFEVTIVK
ncbi:MAG: hypothetical protein IJM50_02505, partial [Lachnospiraceae bacterium]|nr:hypothetical protein [Lachnospiraceae bacterium]